MQLRTRTTYLGQVIPGGGLLGVGQGVSAAVVCDGDVPFFDVDVGGAVLTHGAELDQVALRSIILKSQADSTSKSTSHFILGNEY